MHFPETSSLTLSQSHCAEREIDEKIMKHKKKSFLIDITKCFLLVKVL